MDNLKISQEVIYQKLKENLDEIRRVQEINSAQPKQPSVLEEAHRYLMEVLNSQNITSIRPVETAKKGIVGKVIIFVKKVIRKLTLWYIEPVWQSQTYYNQMSTQLVMRLYNQINEMEHQNSNVTRVQLNQLQGEYNQLARYYNELRDMLGGHENDLYRLDKMITTKEAQLTQKLIQKEDYLNYISEELRKNISDIEVLKEGTSDFVFPDTKSFWDKTTVAQAGEDSIIAYILMVLGVKSSDEYYLDLGANHAKELSNTFMLYKNGMRGVLVEANPQLISELKFYRNQDIILNKCIGNKTGEMVKFYILNGDGLSCTDMAVVEEMIAKNPALSVVKTIEIETITINDILAQYFNKAPLVLNIDIEGMEEEILSSLDYDKYTPAIIVVERIKYDTFLSMEKRDDQIADIMKGNGYFEYAFTGINSIFINEKWLKGVNK